MNEGADRELVRAAQQGNRAAIGALFSRYWRTARAAAFGVTGDIGSAEDAAAGAFVDALAGLNSLKEPDRFAAWLRKIVVRKARVGLRQQHDPLDAAATHSIDPAQPPDTSILRLELARLVRHAVTTLPPALREAVALVYFEGYEPEAARELLGIPAGTLRRRLHVARVRLREVVLQNVEERRSVDEQRQEEVRRLKSLIENGGIYDGIRGALRLRPVPAELMRSVLEGQASSNDAAGLGNIVRQALQPSAEALDPRDRVGAMAAAIRAALPEFQVWDYDTAADLVNGSRWPPTFAEGHPGAFLRMTRALVRLRGDGQVRSMYEHVMDSPDAETFEAAKHELYLTDVIDLTWAGISPLELRSVQEMLERLAAAVLPGTTFRLSTYDEPRYRSAVQLEFEGRNGRAAYGGVLSGMRGLAAELEAAHVRVFVEVWATCGGGVYR